MRLLIISTGAGTGHNQAAAALEEASRAVRPDVEVECVDALDYGTPLLRDLYARSYVLMANRMPGLWGFLYERSETKRPDSRTARVFNLLDRHNARGLFGLVRRMRPDRILCTHFLPVSALSRQDGPPLDVVVTDFDVHPFWIQPAVHRFFVATDDVRRILVRRGIDVDRISVHGIPISRRFCNPIDRTEARASLGLEADGRIVLAMGGGFGRRGLLDVVSAAVDAPGRPVVLAVAGRNTPMLKALQRRFDGEKRVRTFRFVEHVQVLMAASDLVVTKPGGLTTSEALAMGRPLVLTAPVPGQEQRNADYLVGEGVAVTAVTPERLRKSVGSLLGDTERLAAMSEAARQTGRPEAATRIVKEALGSPTGRAKTYGFGIRPG